MIDKHHNFSQLREPVIFKIVHTGYPNHGTLTHLYS